jgi:hypothetical protein
MYNLKMTRRVLGTAAMAMVLTATLAVAQQPGRIRGQIEKVDGSMLSVKTRDGAIVNVKIDDKSHVSALVKASLADIKPDTYIGFAGVPQPDGSIQAFSIHVLPAALRGIGQGERPWDGRPGSTMTNAFAGSSVTSTNGQILMIKNKDGEKKVLITPTTAFAVAAPIEKSDFHVGAQIIIFAAEKQPDGSMLVKVMYVGRGVTPAM